MFKCMQQLFIETCAQMGEFLYTNIIFIEFL